MQVPFDLNASLSGMNEIQRGQDADSMCRALQAHLSEYLEQELNPTLCAELEQHLQKCPHCRVFVDTLQKTILLYHTLPRVSMPPEAHTRLLHVLKINQVENSST